MKSMRYVIVALLLVMLAVPASASYEFPEIDFGGETVSIWIWWDVTGDERFGPDRVAEAEELFNVKLEFPVHTWEEAVQVFMNRLLAGESENDIWYISHEHALPMIAEGAIHPMSTVLPQEYYDSLYPTIQAQIEGLRYAGETYGINTITSPANDMVFWVWNKTLFEREGLPDLDEAYLNGEWTWELATEIAIAATRDTDNDGVVDQYGMAELYPTPVVIAAGGNAAAYNEASGKWEFALADDIALEALNYVYEWNNVHQVVNGDWMQTAFREGTRAFANMPSWMFWALPDEIDDEYGILPYPLTSFNDDYTVAAEAFSHFYVPSNSTNPLGAAALIYFFAPEAENFYYEIIEGAILHQAPDRISAQVMDDAILNWGGEFNLFRNFAGQSIIDDAIAQIVAGEKTPGQAMSEIKPQVQTAIDNLMKQ